MKKPFDSVEDSITPKPLKVLWTIIKIVLALGLILMLGWLGLRSCYQDGTAKMKRYMWTESAAEQYENGTLTVKRFVEYNDPELSMLFFIGRIYYTEELGQFQFMLRYNVLSEYYKELNDEYPDFAFELIGRSGDTYLEHYTKYCYITDSALMYKYYRLAFENVNTDLCDELYVVIYYVNNHGEYSEIGRCTVWEKDAPSEEYDLSSGEKKASKPTPNLIYGEFDPKN